VNGFKAIEGGVCGWRELLGVLDNLERASRLQGKVLKSNGGSAKDGMLLCQGDRNHKKGERRRRTTRTTKNIETSISTMTRKTLEVQAEKRRGSEEQPPPGLPAKMTNVTFSMKIHYDDNGFFFT
jgi:hypothetical protein